MRYAVGFIAGFFVCFILFVGLKQEIVNKTIHYHSPDGVTAPGVWHEQ